MIEYETYIGGVVLESEKKKKKKRKVKYSILLIPDVTTAEVKRFSLSQNLIHVVSMSFLVLICAIIIYGYYVSNHMVVANTSIQLLKEQLKGLEEEKAQLETAKKELTEKVAILSDTINNQEEARKSQEESLAEKYMPTAFPLTGTASYSEDTKDAQGEPIVIFTAAVGTEVIPAGNGRVADITEDADYGYCIAIDHDNGYISYYRDASAPCVEAGDEVTRTTVLYKIEAGGENLGYQIVQDESYIDPLELMEIYG